MDHDMALNQMGGRLQAFAIRGLAGGAPFHFSGGMDTLAAKLTRIGVSCAVRDQGSLLRPYGAVRAIFAEALRAAKGGARLALIGHSMGADAALKVATCLAAESVRVPLVVCFDPTAFSLILGPPPVPRNVGRVVSFHQKITPLGRGILRAGPGFAGDLIQERHARIHSRIDDDPQLQDRVIAEFRRLQGGA
jgi:pimeloyl-ACP methyl ester carboxylesterase